MTLYRLSAGRNLVATSCLLAITLFTIGITLADEKPAKKPHFDPVRKNIEGWNVDVDPALLEGKYQEEGTLALQMLANHLQRIKVLVPDLVLLDLNLPGYGGAEVLRRCRSHEALCALSIVVLTSSEAPSDKAEAQAAGADGYLPKARSGTTLGDRLLELLEGLGG